MSTTEPVKFPHLIEIAVFDNGYVAKMNQCSSFYETFEVLVKAVQPCIRQEFNACKGSCQFSVSVRSRS